MAGHWIRTNGHVRVPMHGGGNLSDGLMAVGIVAGFVILLIIVIKMFDKCGRK